MGRKILAALFLMGSQTIHVSMAIAGIDDVIGGISGSLSFVSDPKWLDTRPGGGTATDNGDGTYYVIPRANPPTLNLTPREVGAIQVYREQFDDRPNIQKTIDELLGGKGRGIFSFRQDGANVTVIDIKKTL